MGDRHKTYFVFERPWGEEDLEEFVRFLNDRYTVSLPTGFEDVESVRPKSEITQPIHYVDELMSGYGSIDLLLDGGITCTLFLNRNPEQSAVAVDYPGLFITIPDRYFYKLDDESDAEAVDRIDELYELFTDIYEYLVSSDRPPFYVYGLTGEDERRIAHPDYTVDISRNKIENREMPGVYWCQIIPPDIVAKVGEDTLLSTSVYKTERLNDGAVLLVLHQYPYPINDVQEEEVAEHLGVPY